MDKQQIIDAYTNCWLSWEDKLDYVNEVCGTNYVSVDSLRTAIKRFRRQTVQDIEIETQKSYEIEDDNVVFYITKKDINGEPYKEKISINREEIKEIWYDYSNYGKNRTGQQIINDYWLKPEVWNLIKSRLWLQKYSHAVPPYELEHTDEQEGIEWVKQLIKEVSHKSIHDRYKDPFNNIYKHQEEQEKQKFLKLMWNFEYFLEYINEWLKDFKPKLDDIPKPTKSKWSWSATVFISDIHFGKKNTDFISYRLQEIVDDCAKYEKINLICLWDIFENMVIDWMHTGQVAWMEMHGEVLFNYALQEIFTFIMNLTRRGVSIKFYWLTWNHDRVIKEKGYGLTNFAWFAFYKCLNAYLWQIWVDFTYLHTLSGEYKDWASIDLDTFRYIFHHGDKNMSSKRPQDILWQLWDNTKHNIIVFWDKHHFEWFDISDNATKIIVPCLWWAGTYDDNLLLKSYPWYVIVEEKRWKPMTTTIRL